MAKLSSEKTICLTRPRSNRFYNPWTGTSKRAMQLQHMLTTVLIPACEKAGYDYKACFQPRMKHDELWCPACPSSVTLSLTNENSHYRHEMTLSHVRMVAQRIGYTCLEEDKLVAAVRALMFMCKWCKKEFTRKESVARHVCPDKPSTQEPSPAPVPIKPAPIKSPRPPRPPKAKKCKALPTRLSRLTRAVIYDSPEPAAPLACAPHTPSLSPSAGPSSIDGSSPASQLSDPLSTPDGAFEPWMFAPSPPVLPYIDDSWMSTQLPAAPAFAQPQFPSANTREIVPIVVTVPQQQEQLWDGSWMQGNTYPTMAFDLPSYDTEFDIWANMATSTAESIEPQIYDAYPESLDLSADQLQWGPQDDQWAHWVASLL